MRDNSIAGLAKVLSRDCDLKITISGERSYISQDGSYINLARMEDTPTGRMLVTGLCIHEVGHKNHSDLASKPPGLIGHIVNIIEDIRVEALTIKERPGTSFDLDAVMKHYVDKGGLDPVDLSGAICGKVMAYGRAGLLGQECMRTIEPACDEIMEDAFGKDFIGELLDIIEPIPFLTSSADSVAMAQKVHDLIEHQKEKPSNEDSTKQENEGGKENEQDENTNNEGRGATENSGENSEEDKSPGSAIPNGSNNTERTPEDSSTTSEGIDKEGEETKASMPSNGARNKLSAEQTDKLLADESDYGDLSKMIQSETNEMATENDSVPLLPGLYKDKQSHSKLNEVKAISASSRMRAKMMGMLQDIKRQPESFGSSGKKLSTSRLHKIALGDPRIFTKKIEVKDINTAIVIAIDYSGSMRGRNDISNPAAYAIHNALFGLKGAATASIGFGCKDSNYNQQLMVLVDFKQKPTSDKFNRNGEGSTPTHEAIWAARAMLLSRPEPRKILLVITDGDPDDFGKTIKATEKTERDGIEIAAVGVCCPCVKRLWKKSKVINTIEELPSTLFEVMNELLIERRK
jgi:cobaltochelatase CobT